MSNHYALLIGVDFYFEYTLPDGIYYPTLGGCVRDIRHVEAYLTDPARLNLPRENLLMLTATNGHGDTPVEPPEQWPTYANMIAKFQQLTEMAQADDQIYIQYSGHGGRAHTAFPDLKGDTGVDEALVPLDIGDPQAQYLRDAELHFLINALVEKGVRLTVVFDCCNSGGATRGNGGARVRGLSQIDMTARPTNSLVATPALLNAAWQAASGGNTRATKPASGWLLEPKGYTFLAACRASESAFEYPFNGIESNGALTYWMLDTLRQAGPDLTYRTLHDRVVAKVRGQFDQQTPMLQGEGDLRVFGSERLPPNYTIGVLQVDPLSNRVRLMAGEVHGVAAGTQFAIYPFDATDFSDTTKRLGLVEATQVNETDTWATIIAQSDTKPLEVGTRAILHSANFRTRREVIVLIDDPARKQQLESAIEKDGHGFIDVADAGKSDFQVAIVTQADGQRIYEVWDAAGVPLPNLRPAIPVDAPDAQGKLVQRLVHLAKYYNVRDLVAPDPIGAQKLQVSLTPISGDSPTDAGGVPIYQPGQQGKLVIKNTQTPGTANDPARILNITVFDLAPDWSITQIFPAGSGDFEPLDPDSTFEFDFEAFLPEERSVGTDTFKVFATQSATSFRWLQLPTLDQPPVAEATSTAAQRSAINDPLEQLLASLTGDQLTTREVRITSSPQRRSWTTAQVELRVQAKPAHA